MTEESFNLSLLYRFLIQNLKVNTIILFGSTARGEQSKTSDIDILLITEKKIKRREVLKIIPESIVPKNKLGLAVYSSEQIISSYKNGSLFMAHLLKEGKVVYDNGFFRELSSDPFVLSFSRMKLSLQIFDERLELTNDLHIYDKHFVRVLSDFYAMAKNTAFIILAHNGHLIFNRKKAFVMIIERYPSYKDTIEMLEELEPFYKRIHGGITEKYPNESVLSEEKVAELRSQLKKLISLGEQEIDR
jgi:hypothetical protein